MIVDESSDAYIQNVLAGVPDFSGDFDSVLSRGIRRRRLVKAGLAGKTLAALLVVMSPLLLTIGGVNTQDADAGSGSQTTIRLHPNFAVAVEVSPAHSEGAVVYLGLLADDPIFDLSAFGKEVAILRRNARDLIVPPSKLPWERNALRTSRLVYIGDVGNAQLALNVFGGELCMFFGNGTKVTGGGYCGVVDTPEVGWSTDPAQEGWLIWSKLPEETAVVRIELENGSLYWQRPVARTVFFAVAPRRDLLGARAIAFDAKGTVLVSNIAWPQGTNRGRDRKS